MYLVLELTADFVNNGLSLQLFSPKGWGFLFSRRLSLGHRPEGRVPRRQWAPLLGRLMGGSPVSWWQRISTFCYCGEMP